MAIRVSREYKGGENSIPSLRSRTLIYLLFTYYYTALYMSGEVGGTGGGGALHR